MVTSAPASQVRAVKAASSTFSADKNRISKNAFTSALRLVSGRKFTLKRRVPAAPLTL